MKALLSFASALSDPLRLRILALAQDRKISTADLASVLKVPTADIAKHTNQLIEAGLLKADKESQTVREKRKVQAVVSALFGYFAVSPKKDAQLKTDAEQLKRFREAKRAVDKAAKKQKPTAVVKKAKTK
jgi:DNA-binding transcriptional ArsR family regulator